QHGRLARDAGPGAPSAVRRVGAAQAGQAFPYRHLTARGHRHRPQIHQAELEAGVRRALSGGWDPHMRGKPFHIDI
ncbi:MAG: hypothetical protein ACO1O3_20075, partial [Sphingobium sp.]